MFDVLGISRRLVGIVGGREGNPYVFIVAIGVCAEKHGRAQVPEANFQNSETFRRGDQPGRVSRTQIWRRKGVSLDDRARARSGGLQHIFREENCLPPETDIRGGQWERDLRGPRVPDEEPTRKRTFDPVTTLNIRSAR